MKQHTLTDQESRILAMEICDKNFQFEISQNLYPQIEAYMKMFDAVLDTIWAYNLAHSGSEAENKDSMS